MCSGPYNHTMQKLRRSKLPNQFYAGLATAPKNAWADETTSLPDIWGGWRGLIAEFHLSDHAPMATWAALIANLQEEGLKGPPRLPRPPLHLTDLTLEKVRVKYNMGAILDMPQILCQAATRQLTALGTQPSLPSIGSTNVETLPGQIRAKNINDTQAPRDTRTLVHRAGGPSDFDRLTPGNRAKWSSQATAPSPSWAPSS